MSLRATVGVVVRGILLLVVALAGCTFDGTPPLGPDGPPGDDVPDAPPGTADAPAGEAHLLLTEVRTLGMDEFIEIYNPGDAAVSLTTYYLTDFPDYARLPAHEAGNVTINPGNSDFIVKFPAGATLAAHAVAVIAIDGPPFVASFEMTPDYTIGPPVAGATPMLATNPSTTGNLVTLTNTGELVALFRWDGSSDRIVDVDLVLAGNDPDPGNDLAAKTDVDGPDADDLGTPYAPDALTLEDMETDITDVNGVQSYKRIAGEAGAEIPTGGNGVGGHDETSEQARTTWDSTTSAVFYTVATPGSVPF
jgi:hypothetical protein